MQNNVTQHMEKTVALLLFFLFVAAVGLPVLQDDPYALRPTLVGEPAAERIWLEPAIEKVATLSQSEEYSLNMPQVATLGPEGSVLVYDLGDLQLKAFASDGTYLRTYGYGQGTGIGEIEQLRYGGVWQDSLVFLVDGMQRQVNLFDLEGQLLETESYPEGVLQYVRGADGTRYVRLPPTGPEDHLLEVHTPGAVRQVPWFSEDPPDSGVWHDGWLNVHGDRALYAALYAPVILAYTADDTVGTAHPTPDFGGPFHGTPTHTGEGIYHMWSEVDGDALSVQLWTTEGMPIAGSAPDTLFFDVYDATDVSYQYSARFAAPGMNATYAPESGLLVAVQDTTVDLYRVTGMP